MKMNKMIYCFYGEIINSRYRNCEGLRLMDCTEGYRGLGLNKRNFIY